MKTKSLVPLGLSGLLLALIPLGLPSPGVGASGGGASAWPGEPIAGQGAPDECVDCHREVTPGIVTDWELGAHAAENVSCYQCHGARHKSADDVDKVKTVTAWTCNICHAEQFQQYSAGKHSRAWSAMQALPTTHWRPREPGEDMQGCRGCHKIGLQEDEEIARLKAGGSGYGYASCDACHTRHAFSVREAREPEACSICHTGYDHPQWEMWSQSKHGARYTLKRAGILPAAAPAPTCQTCHMPDGTHDVHTAWGFLGVRTDGLAPYPGESEQWWSDRVTILKALGVLDPQGEPTERLDVVASVQLARLSAEEFDRYRAQMLAVCTQCHSRAFSEEELGKGDAMIERSDRALAEAIEIVAGLYADGTLEQPDSYAHPHPDLLSLHDSPTPIENALFRMVLEHRMRAFQGTFHNNPDYALRQGWGQLQQDLIEIRTLAEDLRGEREP